MSATKFSAFVIPGLPLIQPGDNLFQLIMDAIQEMGESLQEEDVIVIASKIVAKSQDRFVNIRTLEASEQACELAETTGKDPQLVQAILNESSSVSRVGHGVIVVVHKDGYISANAGIDQSNVGRGNDEVLLLPEDPNGVAAELAAEFKAGSGRHIGVVITDTHGRPFRLGNVGVALGCAGLPGLVDLRGQADLFGREMRVATLAFADLIASTAHLLFGEGDEGFPVVIIRGLPFVARQGDTHSLIRPIEQDMYR
ncbi:coenzyme F420-0:L-glutamate ligase [Anaerolineales bacterium]